MPNSERECYRFGDFVLDPNSACLLRGGEEIKLRPKAFDALRYLVERAGRLVTKDDLVRELWPRSVVTDDSLVKCIQDVRTALGDESRSYVKTVARRGYRFDAPVTVMKPSGVAAGSAAEPAPFAAADSGPAASIGKAGRRGRSRALGLGAAGAVVAVVIAAAVYVSGGGIPRLSPPDAKTIAVLPLANLSPDPESTYFAVGIHESILNQLAKIESIRTIARSTMLRYADGTMPVAQIAAELDAEAVMEGSVRYADGRVLVTTQLIDARTGMHLWSEEYNRPFADIFAIQTDIASRVAAALDAELSADERGSISRSPTSSPQAYALYLRGRHAYDTWTIADVFRSIDYYEQAIRYDPDYALAFAGLADAYSALTGIGGGAPHDLMPKARAAAARALAIDPNLPEALTSMGLIKHFYDWDYAGGDSDMERAIALAPRSASAHHMYGKLLPDTLRFDEALAELAIAQEIEPFSVSLNKDIGEILHFARRQEEAVEQFLKTLELEPGYPSAYFWLTRAYELLDRRDEAVEAHLKRLGAATVLSEGPGLDAEALQRLEETYRDQGWEGYWRADLVRLTALIDTQPFLEPYRFVETLVRLGEIDEAFAWLERTYQARSAWFPIIAYDPLLDPLHGDPRFAEMLRLAGHDAYFTEDSVRRP